MLYIVIYSRQGLWWSTTDGQTTASMFQIKFPIYHYVFCKGVLTWESCTGAWLVSPASGCEKKKDTFGTGPQNTKLSTLKHIISIHRQYGEWYSFRKASSTRKQVKKHMLWMSFHIQFFLSCVISQCKLPTTLVLTAPENYLIEPMSPVVSFISGNILTMFDRTTNQVKVVVEMKAVWTMQITYRQWWQQKSKFLRNWDSRSTKGFHANLQMHWMGVYAGKSSTVH